MNKIAPKKLVVPVWLAGVTIAAIAAPFGTYAIEGFWVRFIYWGLVTALAAVMSTFLIGVSDYLVDDNRAVLAGVVQVALVTLIVSPVLWAFSLPFGDLGLQVRLPDMGLYVAIVAAGFGAWRATHQVEQSKDAPEEEAETKAGPRLMRRLPVSCDGHVIRLNVTDHQVKVITTDGEFSVRLRFGDAIEEMDPVDGYCTHRSHWVARRAVSGWERENGKTYLVLVNGDKVPVSRTYRPDLEEAGLL